MEKGKRRKMKTIFSSAFQININYSECISGPVEAALFAFQPSDDKLEAFMGI